MENGRVGYLVLTMWKNCLALLLLRLYYCSISLLKTVHLISTSFGIPSPDETYTSRAKISPAANSQSSTLYSGVSLLIMLSFPSFKCFFILWERTPWTGFTSNSSQTSWILAVTSWLSPPTFKVLAAAWNAFHAAKTASAYLPLDFPPTTMVWAALAAYPSMCAPNSILQRSSFAILMESSGHGE